MSAPVVESGSYKNLSASGLVKDGPGALLGIFVASSSSGTVKVWDNSAGSGTVLVNATSVAAATFYPMPGRFNTGCYVTIGGTADITVFWTD
jgi:hypothetical protein